MAILYYRRHHRIRHSVAQIEAMIADILLIDGGYPWPGGPVARTDYPTLIFHGECVPPLGVGSAAVLGRYKLVVVAEEPDTATVLVRRRGLWGWLRWVWWKVKGNA